MLNKKAILFVALILVAVLAIGCSSKTSSPNLPDVVATVNGVEITKEMYIETVNRFRENYEWQGVVFEGEEGEALLEQVQEIALNSLIEQESLVQQAFLDGLEVSEELLNEEIESIKAEFGSEEEFETALAENNYTIDSFKEILEQDLLLDMYFESKLEDNDVTEDELREAYEEYLEEADLYAEMYGEEFEILSFEEIKEDIEISIKRQKQNQQISTLIDEILARTEIEIFI